MKLRWLFAESSNFLLYDFFQDSGSVDESIFAYSNRSGGHAALVVYNNRYGTAHGTIDFSAAYADKGSAQLRQQRVTEGLGLTDNAAAVLAWRDSLTGLEYLRRANDLAERGLTLDLHAYQCHVFLDWRELYSTAEKPWDRLCDQLNGRGVPSLEDALVNLELRPVHDAVRALLDPSLVRLLAELAGRPRAVVGTDDKKVVLERREFFDLAWARCESLLRVAQAAYTARTAGPGQTVGAAHPTNPALLGPAFKERLRAAMRFPAIEALFPVPWSVAARRVLPSVSPQFSAAAMWSPVLGWCALQLLAESIDVENPEKVALDVFDRLRLREPFAQAFAVLGFEGEEAWRAAARIKVVLLSGAGAGTGVSAEAEPVVEPGAPDALAEVPVAATRAKTPEPVSFEPQAADEERVALSPALWLDPDVRWLTGVHEADGHAYLVSEPYEELLWWLLMPSLLRLAGEATLSRIALEQLRETVVEALATAKAAGYRIDLLLGSANEETAVPESDTAAMEPENPEAAIEGLQAELEPIESEVEAAPASSIDQKKPE